MTEKWKNGWHLDKRVNLSIIIALLVQIVGFTWYMGTVAERVNTNPAAIVESKDQQDTLRKQGNDQRSQLSRIETEIVGLRRDIGRLIEAIEK